MGIHVPILVRQHDYIQIVPKIRLKCHNVPQLGQNEPDAAKIHLPDMQFSLPMAHRQQDISNNALTHWGRDKMAATLADDTFKCKFVNENILISIKISLKFVPTGPINNMPTLV